MHAIENIQRHTIRQKERPLREHIVAKISEQFINETLEGLRSLPQWITAKRETVLGEYPDPSETSRYRFERDGHYYIIALDITTSQVDWRKNLTVTKYKLKPGGIINLNDRTVLTLKYQSTQVESDRGLLGIGRVRKLIHKSGHFGLEVAPLPEGVEAVQPNLRSTVGAIRNAWPELFKQPQTEGPVGVPA